MENLFYYYYDQEDKTIKVKKHEGASKNPPDVILGMEFFAPEKTYAEMCAKNYTARLVKNAANLENAPDDALYIEVCKDCGRAFAINKEEFMWFKTRDFIPPKRCKACRTKRKNAKEENKENK